MVARITNGGRALTKDGDSSGEAAFAQAGRGGGMAFEDRIRKDPMEGALVQVQWTIDDEDKAEQIIDTLLAARLVACAQVLGPITSRYWWQGSMRRATEWLVVCKTTSARATEAVASVVAQHPYEVPEVMVTPVLVAPSAYERWVAAETVL